MRARPSAGTGQADRHMDSSGTPQANASRVRFFAEHMLRYRHYKNSRDKRAHPPPVKGFQSRGRAARQATKPQMPRTRGGQVAAQAASNFPEP